MVVDDVEVVIHPVRLRILQSLEGGELTTQQIANIMPDIPKSSLYRHLRLLLESEFVSVAEIRLVQGIQEKVYRLSRPARLGLGDMADLSADEHLRYFTTYLMTLLRGFSDYLSESTDIDFLADRVGYNEISFWATKEELDAFAAQLNSALTLLLDNKEGDSRRKHKLAIIAHPLLAKGIEDV